MKLFVRSIVLWLVLALPAMAATEVNTAQAQALAGVRGIGDVTANQIVRERQAHGSFRHWTDFENRVRGIGSKRAAALSNAGLTVNGKSRKR